MKIPQQWLQRIFGIILVVTLSVGLVLILYRTRTALPAKTGAIAQVSTPIVALSTSAPEEPSTPTVEPLPSAIPTPEVALVPTFQPPYIENLPNQPLQSFWIYYWQGNEVWRVDNQGKDNQLLLDTYQQFGQWLTEESIDGSDCCNIGPRIVVSPSGKRLALVVADKDKVTKVEDLTFSIYTYDTELHTTNFVSQGNRPTWSSDDQSIAFLNQGSLWIANLAVGDTHELITKDEDTTISIAEFVWSPDNKQIAYMYDKDVFQRLPAIWIIGIDGEKAPVQILKSDFEVYGLKWAAGGQEILYISTEGSKDRYEFNRVRNLWAVTIGQGVTRQLTQDMAVSGYGILPNQAWLYFSAYRLYEFTADENVTYDLWLLDIQSGELRRVTIKQGSLFVSSISPDGIHLIVSDDNADLQSISLFNGEKSTIALNVKTNYTFGGAK